MLSYEQIVRMDGLIKNLIEPARSAGRSAVSAVTEVPLSDVQTFIPLAESKTKYETEVHAIHVRWQPSDTSTE